MASRQQNARKLFFTPHSLTPTDVSSETVTIAAGAAGTLVDFYLAQKPIIDSNGCYIGGFGDTSLVFSGNAIFTTEVGPDTADADLSNGDYWVDYVTGRGRGRKATTDTSTTADYQVFN